MSQSTPGQKHKRTVQDEFREQFKDVVLPDDFEDEGTDLDFLRFAVQLFDDDLQADKANRDQGIEDAKFAVGEQWDEFVKQNREAANKPTMVFNRMPAFIAQIVGNRRLNETNVKIVADDKSFKKTAEIREGLVRSIQKFSKADIAYNKALENQVITGMGNIEICLEYAHDDVFEQDIKIKAINNTFSIVWDRFYQDPTGADADHCFQIETMDRKVFHKQWPDARAGDPSTDTRILGLDNLKDTNWITRDEVRIMNFWRMRTRKRTVALLRDETDPDNPSEDVEDVTDMDLEDFQDRIVTNEAGMPIMREVDRKYAQMYVMTATDILEGPYELPISRVPIFAVPGWDINVGEYRTRFGLVRFLKDPQRLHNYWRSIIAEKLMLTPKGNWIATEEAVAGREQEWRDSHLSNDPLLVYNSDGAMPKRVEPAQIEAGLIQEANMAAQDLRDISNIHEASLGQTSNEVSGKAITARQRVGEIGTVIYQDNLDLAIEAIGEMCNELIPFVYNTARTIKVMGSDGKDLPPVIINDETSADFVDITVGKYSVSTTNGPSYATKRAEASESMLNMVNAAPQLMGVALHKIVEAQDWPEAEAIAAALKSQLPPGAIPEDEMNDEQKAQAAQAAEQQAIEQQKQDAILEGQLRETNAKAAAAEANAVKAQAQAAQLMSSINIAEFTALNDVEDDRVGRILEAAKLFQELSPEEDVRVQSEIDNNQTTREDI